MPPRRASSKDVARQVDRFFDRAFELAAETFTDLWPELTEYGRHCFVEELVDARATSESGAIEDVVDSWYRTLELRRSPGYEEALADAGKSPIEVEQRVHTIEELRGILNR